MTERELEQLTLALGVVRMARVVSQDVSTSGSREGAVVELAVETKLTVDACSFETATRAVGEHAAEVSLSRVLHAFDNLPELVDKLIREHLLLRQLYRELDSERGK